jgi:hypothetical protein
MGRPGCESRKDVEDWARMGLSLEMKCYKQHG